MAAKKRTKDEVKAHRERVSELMLQKHNHHDIARILFEETGVALSRRMISYDAGKIRKNWQNKALQNYDLLMNQELARVDALETSIWEALRLSVEGKQRMTIESVRKAIEGSAEGEDEEHEMVMKKSIEVLEGVAPSPAYFAQIQECQKERRKLLGLYAPQLVGVQKTIVIKGYAEVSPADWPIALEGELIKE